MFLLELVAVAWALRGVLAAVAALLALALVLDRAHTHPED